MALIRDPIVLGRRKKHDRYIGHGRTAPITLTFSRKMDVTTLTPENVAVIYKTVSANARVDYRVRSVKPADLTLVRMPDRAGRGMVPW